jgi:hypothetical protein
MESSCLISLTANPNNRRAHGDPIPDFRESLAIMLAEGGESHTRRVGHRVWRIHVRQVCVGLRLFLQESLHGVHRFVVSKVCGIVSSQTAILCLATGPGVYSFSLDPSDHAHGNLCHMGNVSLQPLMAPKA